MCQLREHLARIFFPAHCTCKNFFWHDGLVQEFFSYAYALAGYFFSKSPTPPPPPSEVEWSAPKNVFIIRIPVTSANTTANKDFNTQNKSQRKHVRQMSKTIRESILQEQFKNNLTLKRKKKYEQFNLSQNLLVLKKRVFISNTHACIIYRWSTDATAKQRHKRRTSHLIFKSEVTKPCEQHKAIILVRETE